MRTLLLLLLASTCMYSYSQNAYYDMRQLVRWSRLLDTSQEKRDKAEAMLVKLLKYSGGPSKPFTDSTSNMHIRMIYAKADSLYSYRERYKIPRQTVLKKMIEYQVPDSVKGKDRADLLKIAEAVDRYKIANAKYNDFLPIRNQYETELKAKSGNIDSSRMKSVIQRALAAIKKDTVNDLGEKLDRLAPQLDDLDWQAIHSVDVKSQDSLSLFKLEPLTRYTKLFSAYLSKLSNNVRTEESNIYNFTMALSSSAIRHIFTQLQREPEAMNRTKEEDSYLLAKSNIEIQNDAGTAMTSTPQRLADLNFPTQAEIVDAIALYLVRRTKQEAALMFIEKLNNAIGNDELAQDIFPATWKIMQMEDSYMRPRFGAQWRNAIATDYITLPQNIMNSRFIKNKLPDGALRNYFSDAVLFGSYVAKKYNFIDIVRTLYSDHSRMKSKWLSIGTDVLYILNEELYDTTSNRYWISPQSFFELDTTQLYCLYDLIRIKYKDKVCGHLGKVFSENINPGTGMPAMRRFYTELLTILQQFYAAQTLPIKSPNGAVVIKDGFWDTQRIFIDFLKENQSLLKITPLELQALQICENAFFVYDYVSNKNYIAAADNIITIINALLQNSKKSLIDLNSKELFRLADQSKNLSNLLSKAQECNSLFSDLLSVRNIIDTLSRLPSNTNLPVSYVTDRFDLNKLLLAMLPAVLNNPAGTESAARLVKYFTDLHRSYTNQLVTTYSQFIDSYKALSKEDKEIFIISGKLLYRNLQPLTKEMLDNARNYSLKENSSYFKWLTDFSELLTEVVNATDASSLSNIIESHALPPGSYRIKRNSNFSIDLNAYVGAYAGFEKIKGDSVFRGVYGLTAPIGISFTWGTRRTQQTNDKDVQKTYISRRGKLKYRTQSSFTLDLSIIDIGAVVSYRFVNNDASKGLPSEVKWEQVLSYGVNARWGIKGMPLCVGAGFQRTPQLRSFKGKLEDAWRYHVGVAFDLPLFNIHRSW